MALNNFIPEIWTARILFNLHNKLVFGQAGVVNRDYEGEIKQVGDTVRINSVGPVTLFDYTKDSDHTAPETLTDAQLALQITRAKGFAFAIDDVDKAQGKPGVMDEAMREAAYALGNAADQFLASFYTDAHASNLIGVTGTPKTDLGTIGQAYRYLVQLRKKLNERNCPEDGRWAVIPPWFEALILEDDNFIGYGTDANVEARKNGSIGRIAGFDILVSNNVANSSSTEYRIMAGHPAAISYAEQVNQIEAYRPERRFADAMKGLHLSGAKVVRPACLAVLTANDPG